MARISKNLYLTGANGMLGSQLVYKKVDGKMIVSSPPIRNAAPTEAQKRQNRRFKYASIFGKSILEDAQYGPVYQAAASKLKAYRSAYQLALTDYLRAPEIGDLVLPSGLAGSVLLVEAMEDPQVTKVIVSILDASDAIVESGLATLETNGIQWSYTLQQDVPEGGQVLVKAYDIPGNVSTKSFVL